MGMNPSRRERWPIPATTRHVWILRDHRFEVPYQGFVCEWKRQSYRWYALVLYVEEFKTTTESGQTHVETVEVRRWLPADRLVPVRSVPEDEMASQGLEERRIRSQRQA